MPTAEPVIVVGAGIGGIATALALARSGARVLVLEQAAEIGEIGAGIQLAPNALRVLDSMGVLEQVYAPAVFPPAATMRDATTGKVISRLAFDEAFVRRYGYPYIVTHRSDLHSSLLAAAAETGLVRVRTDARVVALEQDGTDGVDVTLADGEVVHGTAAVGADGLNSVVRTYVMGDDDLVYAGDFAYRGTVPYEEITERGGKDDMTWWVGPGMHLIQYPVRRGMLLNQVAVFTSSCQGEDTDTWGAVEELDERFADKHALVRQGASLVGRERRWAMVDRAPAHRWTRGSVALLGDAAHPMLQYLAQGACQALEDAQCLASHIDGATNLDEAFAEYEGHRRPRTTQIQRWARRMGEIVHADGVLAALRDEFLDTRNGSDLAQVEWLYAAAHTSSATERLE